MPAILPATPEDARHCVTLSSMLLVAVCAGCGDGGVRPAPFDRVSGRDERPVGAWAPDAPPPGGSAPETPMASEDSGAAGEPRTPAGTNDASHAPDPEHGDTDSFPAFGAPSWLIDSGDAVFFVGNSFLGGDDDRLAELVPRLGAAMDPAITIRTGSHVVYGNNPLSWFFEQPESQEAIQSGDYDIFVIQGEEREPVDRPEEFKQAVREYHRAVTEQGARLMLFMTWDFYWERETTFFEKLSRAYDEMGRELDVPVIPVGLIYEDCNDRPYGGESPYWLTDQGLHQNKMGTVVNVYATFAMLTGIDPEGRPFADSMSIGPDLLRYLSDMSWTRVAPRLGL